MKSNKDAVPKNKRKFLQLALLAFAQFIIAVDYNIMYVALPDIGQALHFTAASLQWIVSAYAIGFGGFLLLGGRAADKLGHRRIFLLGLGLFGVASLVGGFATDGGLLIAARFVQGIGAALLTPATLSLISTTFTEGGERNKALAIWGAAGSGGLAAGAVLGGVLTSWLGWQWVLFVMVPMALAAAIGAIRWLASDVITERSRQGFDALGAILATGGSMSLVFALIQGPEVGWLAFQTLAALLLSALLMTLLVYLERTAKHPLIPLDLFRNKSVLTSIAVILVFQATLGGAYYLLTIFLQTILGYDALQAGVAFLPITLVSMVSSLKITPYLLQKYGMKLTLFMGMLVTGLGLLLLTWGMQLNGTLWLLLPGLIVWGLGSGTTFPTMFIAAASGVKPSEQGVASALASTSQQIGGAIGLALLIAIATAHVPSFDTTTQSTILAGIHLAGVIAGLLTALGALLAWIIKSK
ncbi:MAG TPA: MFS transporter [Verrucomicrobiae bacterium]|nr:MFS transporter [Verrucomicrobiae bacterium]